MPQNPRRKFTTKISILALLAASLSGCFNANNPDDPYENYNRKMYAVNSQLDRFILKPVAKTYNFILPGFAKTGVRNFFTNLNEVPTIGNDVLQANSLWTISDSWRFLINTTIGIGGLFDVATQMKIPHHTQDFGLTLTKWGVRQSPYFIIPVLGPSTSRDTFAFPVQIAMSVPTYVGNDWISYGLPALNIVSKRADLLPTDKVIDESFDPYIFVRSAYMQRRKAEIEAILNPQKYYHSLPSDTPTPVVPITQQVTNKKDVIVPPHPKQPVS